MGAALCEHTVIGRTVNALTSCPGTGSHGLAWWDRPHKGLKPKQLFSSRKGGLEANWELGMESVVHKLNAECLWFGEGLEGDLAAAALSGKVVTTSPTKVVRRWQWPLPGG